MKNKDNQINKDDFKRYMENRMSEAERNRFERELQKNPFDAEALEGYEKISAENLENDITDIKKRIKSSKRVKSTPYWAAAASALLLIAAGLTWMWLDNQPPTSEMAALETETSEEIIGSVPDSVIREQAVSDLAPPASKDNLNQPDEMQEMEEIAAAREPVPSETELDESIVSESRNSENAGLASTSRDTPTTRYNPGTSRAATVQSDAIIQPLTENDDIGLAEKAAFQIDQDAVFPDSFRNLPAEERDRVQEIQGVAVKDQLENESDAYLPDVAARPEGGMENYLKYLEEQAVLPESYALQTDTVEVLLTIDSNGEIITIQEQNNVDSLLFEHSKEIIRNGPKWNPKVVNGSRIQAEADIEIVFRKE